MRLTLIGKTQKLIEPRPSKRSEPTPLREGLGEGEPYGEAG